METIIENRIGLIIYHFIVLFLWKCVSKKLLFGPIQIGNFG